MTREAQEALNNITSILNDFLAPFDCTAGPGSDFMYFTSENFIMYAFVVSEKDTQSFLNFATSLFPHIQADQFLWSVLHELGHHETEDDFDDDEWEEYLTITDKEVDNDTYYNLPIEYAATAWAGEYMTNHPEEVKQLWDKLLIAINNFYDKIEIIP